MAHISITEELATELSKASVYSDVAKEIIRLMNDSNVPVQVTAVKDAPNGISVKNDDFYGYYIEGSKISVIEI